MSDQTDTNTAIETEHVTKVDDKPKIKIKVDEDNMTLGDLEDFEDITGVAFGDAMKLVPVLDGNGKKIPDPDNKGRPMMEPKLSMKGMVAMIFLSMRRDNPLLTLDEVRKMKLSDYDFNGDDDEDPTPPAGDNA